MRDNRSGRQGMAWSRRQMLKTAGLATAGLAMPAIVGRAARAAGGRVVIGTWGGDYGGLLHDNVEVPLLQPQGIEVVQDIGDEAPRVAKAFAQRRLPHGTEDIICAQAPTCYRMNQAGLLETLDTTKVPNLANVLPEMRSDFMAPHIYSPQVLIYNPERVPDPPKTFTDLLDPKYAGKIGFPNANYFFVMMAAALQASGNSNDFEKAKGIMEQLNRNGLRIYPETDSIAPAFKSGEIVVGVMWLARVIMWQNAGIPVKASFPSEGCMLYISSLVVPKNAPNKAAALKYLNAALEPSAQLGFAQKMGYLPTVSNAKLTGKVAEQLAMPDPKPKVVVPDYAYTTKVQSDMDEWWNKTIAHR